MSTITSPANEMTLTELAQKFGPLPLSRIGFQPPPGKATENDVLALHDREGRLYELIDGVLVEKAMGFRESALAAALIVHLGAFVETTKRGIVTSSDGLMRVARGVIRIPDVAFVDWRQLPHRQLPREPIPQLYPDLAVEVLSVSNTPQEMAEKRRDYFAAGTSLVWEIDPDARTVQVFTAPEESTVLTEEDVIDGGEVLPGYSLRLKQLFTKLDPQ